MNHVAARHARKMDSLPEPIMDEVLVKNRHAFRVSKA
jgi:hypothetical protein